MESVSGYSLMASDPAIVAELKEWYESRGIASNTATALAHNHADKPLARLKGDASSILARLMAGEKPKEIAADLGISRECLNAWLLSHASEEWRAISTGRALSRFEDAQEQIENAADNLEVSKGRELGKLAGWNLERLLPKLYGQNKGESGGITINVTVDPTAGGVVIDQGQD